MEVLLKNNFSPSLNVLDLKSQLSLNSRKGKQNNENKILKLSIIFHFYYIILN